MSEPLMEVRDLEVQFKVRRGVTRAVDGVTLEWMPGEIFGVVGESGCGKSTLARALLGLLEPAAGELTLHGGKVEGKSGVGRAAPAGADDLPGPLPDAQPSPAGALDRRRAAGRTEGGRAEHEERVRRALEDVGLDPERFARRYPHQLSGGQRQRVAIAAALVLEPEGLICDEPVSMLDASVRAQILTVLGRAAGAPRAGAAVHHPRPQPRLVALRPPRGHVPGAGRRAGDGGRRDRAPPPSLHPGPGRRDPGADARAAAAGASCSAASSPTPPTCPTGCRFHPRCPRRFEPCDRVDPELIADRRAGAGGGLPAARPGHARERGRGRRWLSAGGRSPGRSAASPPGPRNAITDVPGVRVGQSQAASGEPHRSDRDRPALAAGPGRDRGRQRDGRADREARDRRAGELETPVYLCGSHAVGTVHHAAVLASGRGPGERRAAGGRRVRRQLAGRLADGGGEDVERALGALGDEVEEGTVGAGTGMMCFGFPGGIGTASRVVGEHHVGVLLLCNFGDRERLDLLGTSLEPAGRRRPPQGSCIAVCATDAPLARAPAPPPGPAPAARPCPGRLLRRGGLGGDRPRLLDRADAGPCPTMRSIRYFAAAWEAAHEAVYNCLVAARPGRAPRRRDAGCLSGRAGAGDSPGPAMSEPELREEVVGLARELIRFDTSNPPGNETPRPSSWPPSARVPASSASWSDPTLRGSTWSRGSTGAGTGPSLMLLAHTDVVPAPGAGWTVPPFEGVLRTGG